MPRQAETGGLEAARVGEELREARLALGQSLDDLALRLRIRRPYLEALEDGRIGDLPGAAYAVGFVRTYATGLGLDADEMVRRFREASGAVVASRPKLVFPEPVPERGMPAGAMVAVVLVAAIGGYVAWFNLSGAGSRTVDVVPPVPPRLEAAAEHGRAQLPNGRGEPGAVPMAVLPPPGGVTAPTPAPAPSGANTSAQAATVPVAPTPPAAPPAVTIPGLPDGTRIALRARAGNPEGAWVGVRDSRTGASVLNRVLRPGEAWPVPVRDGLILDTGKADGLEIIVDGQPSPALEGLVGVRRNIPLDPDRLKQRLGPAQATAAQAPAPAAVPRSQ